MDTKKIQELTDEQVARLGEYRDKWLAHGLSIEPADRSAAEAGVDKAYLAAGLEPPRLKIWLRSPLAGVLGAARLARLPAVRDQVWAQVGAQVRAHVRDQVWAQVGAQVGAQVRAHVWDQVRDQVWAQVGAQVRAHVRAQ